MGTTSRPRIAVVLAAGKGTRMRSKPPKPLFEVAGKPMLHWVLEAARAAGCERSLVVVGHQAERLKEAFADRSDVDWVLQEEQLGTGHALAQAEPHVDGDALRAGMALRPVFDHGGTVTLLRYAPA